MPGQSGMSVDIEELEPCSSGYLIYCWCDGLEEDTLEWKSSSIAKEPRLSFFSATADEEVIKEDYFSSRESNPLTKEY